MLTSRFRLSVSHLVLTAVFASAASSQLLAADINIPPGTTSNGQRTFGGTDTITVGAGSVLTSTSNPTLNQTSAATGVVIDNAGTIQSTGATSRAIRFNVGTAMTFTFTNRAGAIVQSATNDPLQVGTAVTSGTIVVNNSGTFQATGVNGNNGQAIDFGNIVASTASVTINNLVGGLLMTADADAIRPGTAATVNNYGSIVSNNFQLNSGADGIDFQTATSGTVNNYNGGVISGARHGVNASFDPAANSTTSSLTVFNDVGGTIIGRNGSGVGLDISGVVTNYGTISGRIDSIPGVANGDGDGVDIDYFATIDNHGLIEGTGAKGVGSDGLVNTSQGVAIGGGTVTNRAGATIRGQADGILADNSSEGPAFGAVTINNAGLIEGTTRYGIFLNSTLNNVITNSGTITGGGGQAIVFGSGNDTLNIRTGSVINGSVDGGAGTDAISLAGTGTFNGAVNFESLSVDSGRWTLSGPQSYVNGIAVAGGAELNAAGTIASDVTVAAGGLVSGVGSLGSLDLSGTLAPGNGSAFATLGVTNNAVFRAGSAYVVKVDGNGNSDRLAVTGQAALAGTVQVAAMPGLYAPQTRYTIVTAGAGVTGAFDGATSNLTFLTPTLSYDATDAFLTLGRNAVTFASVGQTANQRAVGNAFDAAGTATPLVAALTGLSADSARAAFDSLSGEGIAAAQNAAFTASSLFTSAMTDHAAVWRRDGVMSAPTATEVGPMAYVATRAPPSPIQLRPIAPRAFTAWVTGFGGGQTLRGDAGLGTAGQTSMVGGGAVGLDYQVTPTLLVGLAAGGSDSGFNVASRATSGQVTGGHGGIYTTASFGASYVESSLSYSAYDNSTRRTIAGIGPLGGEFERGRFGSQQIRARLEAGRTLAYGFAPLGAFGMTPFAALEIARLRSDGFTEQAAASGAPGVLGLTVGGTSAASVPGSLGVRFDRQTIFANGLRLTPIVSLAYVHEFAPQRTLQAGLLSLPGTTFVVDGAQPARNAARVKAGAELALTSNVDLYANFEGEFAGISTSYAGKGGLRVTW